MVNLGTLVLTVKSAGVKAATTQVSGLQKVWGNLAKRMGPQLQALQKGFKQLAVAAAGAFFVLLQSSPRLQAEMQILTLRVNQLLRVFADELAPILETVTGLVEGAIDVWNNLPGPLQESIIFGVQVAAIVGLVAIAFFALQAAISPVTLAILALIAVVAALHLIWTQNLGGIQDAVGRIFANIQAILEGFVNFFTAIFSGNLDDAWAALGDIFRAGVQLAIDWVTFLPNALIGLIDFLTGGFLSDMLNAGQELFLALIKGMQQALADASGLIADLLRAVMDFFGGSLPEKGPLTEIPSAGVELGETYVTSIGEGLASGGGGLGNIIQNTFNIENIGLDFPGSALEDGESFLTQLEPGVRRLTVR